MNSKLSEDTLTNKFIKALIEVLEKKYDVKIKSYKIVDIEE